MIELTFIRLRHWIVRSPRKSEQKLVSVTRSPLTVTRTVENAAHLSLKSAGKSTPKLAKRLDSPPKLELAMILETVR